MTSLPETQPTTLSEIILLKAAEQTWPGQVPKGGSLSDTARNLRDHIESFPCLTGSTVVEKVLSKLNTVETNGDFVTVTGEIFGTVSHIRKLLEKSGVLHHAEQPHEPMIATMIVPDTQPGTLPIDTIKRLQTNSSLLMILHYTNRILSLLAQASLAIQNQTSALSHPRALVDAAPLDISREVPPSLGKLDEKNITKPEEFIWCTINFDRRMKMVPFLASSYLKGKSTITFAEFKAEYERVMGKELHDANMYALLRNIRTKFEEENIATPFRIQKSAGIEFVYTTDVQKDTSTTEITPTSDISENSFLSQPFDLQVLTGDQSGEIKNFTDKDIDGLDLDAGGKAILTILFHQTGSLHISEIAQQSQKTIQEVNAYLALILQKLGMHGFTVWIEVENDCIRLIK